MRKVIVGVSAVLLILAISAACLGIFRFRATLNEARRQVRDEGTLVFDILPLTIATPTAFEPLAAPGNFTTGAALAGKLYLAGPGGIAIYDNPDATPKLLQPGLDLPAAPIVALVSARLRGQNSPHLLAATHGEGLLLFTDDTAPPQQLLPKDPAARDITAILPLPSGDLLLGTRRAGLLLYNGATLRLFQPGFANLAITALAGDETDFWVGTQSRGLLHWHAGQLDTFDQTSGLPDPQIESIAITGDTAYVGTPLGIAVFTAGQPARTLAAGLFAHALALDANTLFVATIDQGLHQIPLKPSPSPRHPQLHEPIAAINFFTTGNALLAVTPTGLLRREASGLWQPFINAAPHSLTDRNISSLSFAPDDRLWIGYFDRGLDILNLQTNAAQHLEDDHLFCINRILPDPQRHTLDVATANGLVLFDPAATTPRARQILSRRDGLLSDQIADIAFTHDGLALATPAGITFFTPSGAQSLYSFHGLVNNHVYTLAADPATTRVYAGTLGGLSILDDLTVRQNVTLRNSGLNRNWITAILHAPQENTDTWLIGTYGGGVLQMDASGRITPMDGARPTSVINPNAMLLTPQHVFAGSLADGLLVYNRASRHWSHITSGLPSRNVTALAEHNGELYIGTDNGLVRIAESRLP
jgi:ligand-binding sensor domain-containing protein